MFTSSPYELAKELARKISAIVLQGDKKVVESETALFNVILSELENHSKVSEQSHMPLILTVDGNVKVYRVDGAVYKHIAALSRENHALARNLTDLLQELKPRQMTLSETDKVSEAE